MQKVDIVKLVAFAALLVTLAGCKVERPFSHQISNKQGAPLAKESAELAPSPSKDFSLFPPIRTNEAAVLSDVTGVLVKVEAKTKRDETPSVSIRTQEGGCHFSKDEWTSWRLHKIISLKRAKGDMSLSEDVCVPTKAVSAESAVDEPPGAWVSLASGPTSKETKNKIKRIAFKDSAGTFRDFIVTASQFCRYADQDVCPSVISIQAGPGGEPVVLPYTEGSTVKTILMFSPGAEGSVHERPSADDGPETLDLTEEPPQTLEPLQQPQEDVNTSSPAYGDSHRKGYLPL